MRHPGLNRYIFIAIFFFLLATTPSTAQVGYTKAEDRAVRREERREKKEYRRLTGRREKRRLKKAIKREEKAEDAEDKARNQRIIDYKNRKKE